jgi:hypothetical protein
MTQRCLLLLALTLTGCATLSRVDVAQDPLADFSRYATFSFHDPLGTDREDGTHTILSQTLREATRNELEARGYRYDDGDADLRVNFFIETREVIEGLRRPGLGVGYGVFHRHYGVWADYETDIRQYTEGTLHVDVIDAARGQLVWEGLAQGRLAEHDFAFAGEEVAAALASVFAEFPRRGSTD